VNQFSEEIKFEIFKDIIPYAKAIEIMHHRLDKVISDIQKQTILFLEHKDVYTAGRMACCDSDIIDKSINVIQTDRGGKITYHGPGQRVIYPILNLNYFGKDIKKYVSFLQSLIINCLNIIGIKAHIDKAGVGIWTIYENDLYKIASIGIKVKKWVAYHGLSINISNDLAKFDSIIPCGIKEYKHTSIKKLGIDISLEEFDQIFIKEFKNMISSYK
jgi:lipoyl(octanoyl) transferase